MMKILIIIISLLSFSAYAENAAVYSFNTASGGFCSATLVKINGSCKLMTNAHCVKNVGESLSLSATKDYMSDTSDAKVKLQQLKPQGKDQFSTADLSTSHARWAAEKGFFGKEKNSIQVSVKIFNRSKDLAILDYASALDKTCKQLAEQSTEKLNIAEVSSANIVGYTKDTRAENIFPKVFYPQSTVISGSKIDLPKINIKRQASHLSEGKQVLFIDGISSLGGTSGGATFGDEGEFLGVTTGMFAGQDTAIVIPREEVLAYAVKPDLNEKKRYKKHPLMETDGGSGTDTDFFEELGGGSGTDTDGGSGTDTDGGSGTDTNDGGSGTDTTGRAVDPCKSAKDMAMFIAVEEGFINDMGKIVLAVGGNQIDHAGDLRDFSKGTQVVRDQLGFLPLDQRKAIFERLSGEYEFPEATHKRYMKNPAKVIGWDERAIGDASVSVKLSKGKLIIHTGDHIMLPSNTVFIPTSEVHSVPPKKKIFNITHSEDYKMIYLKGPSEDMVCKNNSYLRIICSNHNENFSLSLSQESEGVGSFRYSKRRKDDDGTDDMVDYFYGRN